MSKERNCENCRHYNYCPYLHLFNKDQSVECIDFQDKDYGLTSVSNTIKEK